MDNNVVIIGSGHAGVQAAASLREEGYDGHVILVGDGTELPYHKPPLSKSFIKTETAKPQPLRGSAFYTDNAIDYRPGVRVTHIDRAGGCLNFQDGRSVAFDSLILATGSRPRDFVVPGADLVGVCSLGSLEDAITVRTLSAESSDVVIVGGGFIGLELAATLAGSGLKITVCEGGGRLLGRAVSAGMADHVRRKLTSLGIRVLTDTSIVRLDGSHGRVAAAVTSSGERLRAQLVIVGIGAVPNVELAKGAGIVVSNGISVDSWMRTSAPAVLAVGDVTSFSHLSSGKTVRLESVQNATDQARLAARTILGRLEPYSAVPWFWSDIGESKLQMVGLVAGSDTQVTLGDPKEGSFAVYHYLGDQLLGVESINRAADHMLGRKLLKAGFSPPAQTVEAGIEAIKFALSAHH
jgi:3-phenylpropionate/trans-cinnamate dioxygenase ferredoxin reductase subunit